MYAAASRYGDLVFTAGTPPGDTGADIEVQVESALDNLEAALEAAGAGFDTLLKVNIYLTDWDNWDSSTRSMSIGSGSTACRRVPPSSWWAWVETR